MAQGMEEPVDDKPIACEACQHGQPTYGGGSLGPPFHERADRMYSTFDCPLLLPWWEQLAEVREVLRRLLSDIGGSHVASDARALLARLEAGVKA